MQRPERIWIIGASDGIGESLARKWAQQGATLILSARSMDRLQSLAHSLGPQHVAIGLDVADRASIDRAAAQIAPLCPLDRIIHLAAQYDPGKVADLDPNNAGQIVTTNLTGSFHIAQVAPNLLRPMGQLAMCGSVAGYMGLPQGQIYSATKAAVINLTETLRVEYTGQIDVRLISPGFVDTRLTRKNDFQMPALQTPDQAATAIIAGLNTQRFEIHFPRRLTWALKLLRALPYWAALPLTQRLVK
jgi:short-subunit dehydrogenase